MTILNFLGMETGDLTEFQGTATPAVIESTVKATGGYSLKVPVAAATATNAAFFGTLSPTTALSVDFSQTVLSLSFRVRFDSFPSGGSNLDNFIGVSTNHTGPNVGYGLRITSAGALQTFGDNVVTIQTLSTGQFYQVEMRLNKAANTAMWRVDGGTPVTDTMTSGSTFVSVVIGSRGFSGNAYTYYIDDLYLDDQDAWPGAGRCYPLKPNNTGGSNTWTNGAGTLPTSVAETPPDGDTSYRTANAVFQVDLYSCDDAAVPGVPSAPLAVKPTTRVRDTGAAATFVQSMMSAGNTVSGANIVTPGTSTYITYGHIQATNPGTGSAWSLADVDNIQIGQTLVTSVAARCTQAMAHVWANDAVAGQPAVKRFGGIMAAFGGPQPMSGQNRWIKRGPILVPSYLRERAA